MKPVPVILFVLISLKPAAQMNSVNYGKVDKYALSVEAGSATELSKKLTAPFISEKEKVRAIFRWITDNISYRSLLTKGIRKKNYFPVVPDDSAELKSLDERVAETAFNNREAICEGYARLFKSLCDYSGIRSVIISGYGNTESGNSRKKFRSNHAWNAVYADSVWYLLDVTWASGFFYYNNPDFVKRFNDYYFFTPPEKFIEDHQPDDLRWSLLQTGLIPAVWEYTQSPYRTRSFIKYGIISYSPARGVIEANAGDTIRFILETEHAIPGRRISTDSLWEDSLLRNQPSFTFINPDKGNERKFIYTYIAEPEKPEWLHLLYNDDAVLRYRIKIRNRLAKE